MTRVTVATYRLQFIPDFDCDAAMTIAPYLADWAYPTAMLRRFSRSAATFPGGAAAQRT